MSKIQESYDTIIIGAGMSGLGAGIRLAQYDQKVCILEKHWVWGGLNSFYKKEGRQFDVGLHAMTNFAKKGDKRGPLPTIMRQLRLKIDDFGLNEQNESLIRFPSAQLRFNNELDYLESQVAEVFPKEIDGFQKLCEKVRTHNDGSLEQDFVSARSVIKTCISSSLLEDMILCPLMFYGSATEQDMDWNQFVIMFKSIFFEGFCRPHEGVRKILSHLRKAYLDRGGELHLNAGVAHIKPINDDLVEVQLESGQTVRAKKVISSVGHLETLKLLGKEPGPKENPGALSFVESIFCLDTEPKNLDISSTIQFYSLTDHFQYRGTPDLVDHSSGILCCPNNFRDEKPLREGLLRLTNIASHKKWTELKANSLKAYEEAKQSMVEEQLLKLKTLVPDFSSHITCIDSFTPATIEKFTGHIGGAVYGAPKKVLSGDIGEKNVFICGTDQGYLGIVGALLSGILMANRHAL